MHGTKTGVLTVSTPVGDSELLLCHGIAGVVRMMRDLIPPLGKSSIYSTKPNIGFSLYSSRHDTRHALLVNDTEHPFITSDQPIVNVHACISETEFSAPEHADFYYPISPRIAYIICDSKRFLSGIQECHAGFHPVKLIQGISCQRPLGRNAGK